MAKILVSTEDRLVESRNDNELSQLQTGGGDGAAETGEIVFVAASDLLDKMVGAQSFEHSGDLGWRECRKAVTEATRLESGDGEFASGDGLKEIQIGAVEEIEAAVAPVSRAHWRRDFLQGVKAGVGIIDGGQEVEVPIGGRSQKGVQGRQAVDGLAHGSKLELDGSVPMFHRAVVLEKGHVIGSAFDAPDDTELVVKLDGHCGPIWCLMQVPSMRVWKSLPISPW